MQPKFGKSYSRVCRHCGGWTLVWCFCFNSTTVRLLSSVGRFLFPTHLWGRGLFDHVKGSPSIRQCVLILALGRFPIDYLTTQKHSTSLDRPAHIQPNQSWPSAYLPFWVWPCLRHTATWLHAPISTLKTHKYLYYWVQDKVWMDPAASKPDSLCYSHYHCKALRLAGAQYSHLHSWKAMPPLLISSGVRQTYCGGDKAVWYPPHGSDPCMNGQSSLILSAGGGEERRITETKCQG